MNVTYSRSVRVIIGINWVPCSKHASHLSLIGRLVAARYILLFIRPMQPSSHYGVKWAGPITLFLQICGTVLGTFCPFLGRFTMINVFFPSSSTCFIGYFIYCVFRRKNHSLFYYTFHSSFSFYLFHPF